MSKITQPILASLFVLGFFTTRLNAQQVGNITTMSSSCKVTISACEGDTLTLRPQDQASFTNYKWYRGTIAPANQITAANAATNNVVASIFTDSFPTLKVISGGGIYYLTADYASPANCAAINDTFELNFTPRPVANTATLAACELMNGGGTANFTLTNADATVTGGAVGVTVTYHTTLANAKADVTPLSSPYNSASKTIYARVENNVTGCYQTVAITLTLNPKPVIADGAVMICSGNSTNLTTQIASYATYSNPVWAISTVGGTAVSTPTAVSPTSLTTYVLVAENGSGCKDTANVVVTVNPNPDFTLVKPAACPGTSEDVNITGLTNAIAATAQLKIDAGAYGAYPSPAIVTSLAVGSHALTVRNAEGCETIKNITISPITAAICIPVTVTRN